MNLIQSESTKETRTETLVLTAATELHHFVYSWKILMLSGGLGKTNEKQDVQKKR